MLMGIWLRMIKIEVSDQGVDHWWWMTKKNKIEKNWTWVELPLPLCVLLVFTEQKQIWKDIFSCYFVADVLSLMSISGRTNSMIVKPKALCPFQTFKCFFCTYVCLAILEVPGGCLRKLPRTKKHLDAPEPTTLSSPISTYLCPFSILTLFGWL